MRQEAFHLFLLRPMPSPLQEDRLRRRRLPRPPFPLQSRVLLLLLPFALRGGQEAVGRVFGPCAETQETLLGQAGVNGRVGFCFAWLVDLLLLLLLFLLLQKLLQLLLVLMMVLLQPLLSCFCCCCLNACRWCCCCCCCCYPACFTSCDCPVYAVPFAVLPAAFRQLHRGTLLRQQQRQRQQQALLLHCTGAAGTDLPLRQDQPRHPVDLRQPGR